MLPQPMMPMSIRAIVWSDSHAADESVAGSRGLSRIGGLVMLDHHPPCAGRAGGLPQVAPVEYAGPDIGPAVLFLVLPRRRDILHVRGDDAVPVSLHPLLGINAAPDQPGNVNLPGKRTALRPFEDQLQRSLCAVFRCKLPVVVVIAQRYPLIAHALCDLAELVSQRVPERCFALPLFWRYGGHEKLVEAQYAAVPYHCLRPLTERHKANVTRGNFETARIKPGAYVLGVVQMEAK